MRETFFGCNRLELELQNFGIPVKRNGTNLGSDRQTIEFEEEEIWKSLIFSAMSEQTFTKNEDW